MMKPHPVPHKDHHILAIIVGVAALGWLIFPPGSVALDDACRPVGLKATLSASITRGWFWQRQLTAIETERDRLLAIQNRGEADQDLAKVSPIESRMDRLSRRDNPHDDGKDVKDAWIQDRQTSRIARLAILMQCADRIERGN